MRYRLAVLMLLLLLAMLLVMDVLAAPAPDPYGMLDIGPPPKGKTAQEYLKDQIEFKTHQLILSAVCSDPGVRKLPSVASMKDARPWLAKNLRLTPEEGGRRLRFDFRAGKRNEQVAVINAFLRASISWNDVQGMTLKCSKEWVQRGEKSILELEQRIASGQHPHMVDTYQKEINYMRYTSIPELRAEIARLEQYAVIRWAR